MRPQSIAVSRPAVRPLWPAGLLCVLAILAGLPRPAVAQASSSAALAQEAQFDLDIPAGSLVAALDALRSQTGAAIVYSPQQLAQQSTPALGGRYSVAAALGRLLDGTHFVFSDDGRGTFVVRPGTAASPPAAPLRSSGIEEIVVTAQKREEKAKDVAGSLTALSGQALDKLGAKTIGDYAAYVPGMGFNSGQAGLGQITLRGVTTGVQQSSATVGTYVDDTPFTPFSRTASGTTLVPDVDTFDVQRVEVLRGPQGTLYGAGAMGGLLKYVTTPPSFAGWRGRAELEPGRTVNADGWNFGGKAMLNAPLGDDLALRASGFSRRDAGFIDDVGTGADGVNHSRSDGGRLGLRFAPGERLDVRLTALLQRNAAGSGTSVDVDPDTLRPLYGDLQQSRQMPERTTMRFQVYNLALNWDLDWASFVSSTSYADTSVDALVDYSQSYGSTIALLSALYLHPVAQSPLVSASADVGARKLTQEFRLTSPNNRSLEWIVGAFYTRETTDTAQDIRAWLPDENALLKLAPQMERPLVLSVPSRYREYAGFGSIDWYFTERIDLTLGARWSANRQSATQNASGALWDLTSLLADASSVDLAAILAALQDAGATTTTTTHSSSSDNTATYRIAPRWRVTDDVTLYAAAANGYRPGGPNMQLSPSVPESFGPDSLWSYEAGVKTQLFERRVSFDLAGFYIDWNDIQLGSTADGFSYLANGGAASSRGAEMNFAWRVWPSLVVGVNGAYTRARLDADAPDVGGRRGDALPTVPKWSYSIVVDQLLPLFDDWMANFGASYRYLGARNSSFEASGNKPNVVMPSYQTLNLRAGLLNDVWGLTLFANNVFDERGIVTVDTSFVPDGGAARANVIVPRTIGLRLSAQF